MCDNCNSHSHFAGDEICPNRRIHRSIDTEDPRQVLHDPTTSGKHTARPHPSRRGMPPPSILAPAPPESISLEDLDAAIDAIPLTCPDPFNTALEAAIEASQRSGLKIAILLPDEDTDSTDHTNTHWRTCKCALDTMQHVPCPATRDLA